MSNRFFESEEYIGYMDEIDTSKWPCVLVDNIPEKNQELYLRRKKAVDMFLEKIPLKNIENETNFHRNTITNFVRKCLQKDSDGNIFGYTALIPYKRIKSYIRKEEKVSNYNGIFNQLLTNYPELKEYIEDIYLGRQKNLEKNPSPAIVYKKFINKCHKLGIKENEYPFNTNDAGRRSVYRYLNNLKLTHTALYANRLGDAISNSLMSTGVGIQNNPEINRPFQQVQFDGHKIDAMISIKFTTPDGDIVNNTISRIWILAIIDVATRVILGYHICLNSEYSSEDVLKCIDNAIRPKEKINLTIPKLKYPDNGGFHSIAIPETRWVVWDEFLYDNAMANLSKVVTKNLTQIVKCNINAGPAATPERRGIIERFFKTLETRGYHRLVSTTGSNIKDPRKKGSEESAIKYEISVSEIEELTEILIANYNNTPHSGINNFTPLELMKQRIERGLVPNIIPKSSRNDINFLALKVTRVVRGGVDKGRRPYIHYEGVDYRSDLLSNSQHLVGQKLTMLVNIYDLRNIKAYLSDGSEFGVLTAKGKWGIKPHTLKMRKDINLLKNKKEIEIGLYNDPIEIYHEYLTSKSIRNKSSRNKLAKLNNIQKENDVVNDDKEKKSNVCNTYKEPIKSNNSDDEKIINIFRRINNL